MTEPSQPIIEQARSTLDGKVVIRVLLTLWDGGQIDRRWTWRDVQAGAPTVDMQPWMVKPRKTWPHPQDPITFEAGVNGPDEQIAREWLAAL